MAITMLASIQNTNFFCVKMIHSFVLFFAQLKYSFFLKDMYNKVGNASYILASRIVLILKINKMMVMMMDMFMKVMVFVSFGNCSMSRVRDNTVTKKMFSGIRLGI